MMTRALTSLEYDALAHLVREGGSVLISKVPDKSCKDVFGFRIPGIPTYRALEREGFCYTTEEDLMFPEMPEMGYFTASIELTPEGRAAFTAANVAPAAAKPSNTRKIKS